MQESTPEGAPEYRCGECGAAITRADKYCPKCYKPIVFEKGPLASGCLMSISFLTGMLVAGGVGILCASYLGLGEASFAIAGVAGLITLFTLVKVFRA